MSGASPALRHRGRSMTDTTASKPSQKAVSETGDPFLLTPGPLTTSRSVKAAMVHDWGSRDASFGAINKAVLQRLPEIAKGAEDYVTVPVQGSGTFAVEAMLTSFVPAKGRVLLLINGAYGHRAKRILDIARRRTLVHETPEDTLPDLEEVERLLKRTPSITHIFAVHCETTSGILNPIDEIGALADEIREELPARFDERLRGAAARCAKSPCRCGRGLLEQMHRGRARPRLRHLPEGGARRDQGPGDDARPRSSRPMGEFGEDRAIPLHAADPCDRRLPPGLARIRR